MRRLGPVVVTGLAATLLCASQVSAAAAGSRPGGGGGGGGKEETILLTARPTQSTFIDVPPPGTSQGDELVITGDLLQSGTTVGHFNEVCVITRAGDDDSDLQCQVTLTLPKGQVTVQGVFEITGSGPGDIALAVTGGTGEYETARGSVHAVSTSPDETRLTLHLVR
ncbi:hypothetical protein [Streptomyces sp. NPDC086787]|uniref:allene oxide cyclase barrel-like domain-containing protein n=1 Tax=Streptomyces sp. NPDC086787 TaxID=3365759 RepID=UPI00382FFDC9